VDSGNGINNVLKGKCFKSPYLLSHTTPVHKESKVNSGQSTLHAKHNLKENNLFNLSPLNPKRKGDPFTP
jgi:hypothetical protein